MNTNLKRIALSLTTIGALSAAVFAGTGAFFSDTETSTGNVLVAGALDLQIDSTAHYNGMVCVDGFWADEDNTLANNPTPDLIGEPCVGSFALTDLTTERFFDLEDIKPGDYGENTLSFHADNDYWACMTIDNLQNDDNGLTEPESEVDATGGDDQGELAQNLYFTAWLDQGDTPGFGLVNNEPDSGEGDNIWGGESEPLLFTNQSGPASDVLGGKTYTLADSSSIGGPLAGGLTQYLGVAWCAGTMTIDDVNGLIECDGSTLGNIIQTDSLTADISFYVEQARHNDEFLCEEPVNGVSGVTGATGASGISGSTGLEGPTGETGIQ